MSIKNLIKEDLSQADKSEIRKMIDDEISKQMSGKDHEEEVREIVADSFEKLFKTLWQRRASWRGGIKN